MDIPSAPELQIHWRIKAWYPDLDQDVHDQLRLFFNELVKFNKTVNLIPSKTLANCDLIHFADSINACRIVHKKLNENEWLYDIGSGCGFPGLICGILFPMQKIALIEIDDRKINFLSHVINLLNLKNVKVENKKAESFLPDSITQVICRGFAPLSKTLLTFRKSVKLGGLVFNLKTDDWSMEISQIPTQLCSSWKPYLLAEYKLPVTDIKLYIVEAIKI